MTLVRFYILPLKVRFYLLSNLIDWWGWLLIVDLSPFCPHSDWNLFILLLLVQLWKWWFAWLFWKIKSFDKRVFGFYENWESWFPSAIREWFDLISCWYSFLFTSQESFHIDFYNWEGDGRSFIVKQSIVYLFLLTHKVHKLHV